MKLSQLRQALNGARASHFKDCDVTGVTCDSRAVKPGFLFVAMQGLSVDGHKFIPDAIERGASAVVAEKPVEWWKPVPAFIVKDARLALAAVCDCFYGFPSKHITVIGVTGTNGKTTTTHLIKSVVEVAGQKAGLLGTISYQVGDRRIPARETTPGAQTVQSFLADMVAAGFHYAVMEVSSHALTQHRTAQIRFKSAIFTNLTPEHLDYHRTMENYREAKAILFDSLAPESFAILNADDPASQRFAQTKATVLTYGLGPGTDVSASLECVTLDGMRICVSTPKGRMTVQSPLIGRHNVYNIISTVANCVALGFDLDVIREGVEAVRNVPGRLEPVDSHRDFHVLVDYAHTPDALQNVLSTLKPLTKNRLIVVFGCGGDRDRTKRPKMGHVAEEIADFVWLTSDNPRSEVPESIIREIEGGMTRKDRYYVQPDRRLAIQEALAAARGGDLVLIAGKGHESGQIFRNTVIPFDDRDVARQALSSLN
ncbi:MAG: UDP-N-acetylmuramoyl-L-alanyl-D-glutamate--2,6-diaminopimelate ligase [Planctomycetes bacterium]|nr:UDP-N-acetylmuramoyl-L-alanyl-D-glutamate--2,6-diaminopimelate ligase [Planctomycetota bacterium]MBM4083327.1 UDP-N-acetylmuramoyl-L-alanyl-D-glutamate--2,6-diaminopimelate ligase [Planctomycetota bacterium]